MSGGDYGRKSSAITSNGLSPDNLQLDTYIVLSDILNEMRIIRAHIESMTDEQITQKDTV
jgi:hypothetical protein